MTTCNICAAETVLQFTVPVLRKHQVSFHRCLGCGFLQAEEPYWLEEAYARPINIYDTGILARNRDLSRAMSALLYVFFDKRGHFLDYGGGYGIFTRMMRDIGFDFSWSDPYCQNLFAEGFEYRPGQALEAVTSLENFEHFVKPLDEVAKMLAYSENIMFTTQLLPNPVPGPQQWWYYAFEHGQHVSFYTPEALRRLAAHFGLNVVSDGRSLHLLTRKSVSQRSFRLAVKAVKKLRLDRFVARRMSSRINTDMAQLIASGGGEPR
ncbi:hypothetical protein GMST_39330 [Geomonas silvestris]|uniref:Class I SAM-dependent methyltransferase n=1 Tax=Geomonas silvestris TaxID=2740184 RepID=A0A6V8MNJ6_9BACT|nr:class I SAM-dependent methyltransferase [Geomonas silvestris]GFO61608.1 hypothetical protein GMST_39330 [Geomonas silvestris]